MLFAVLMWTAKAGSYNSLLAARCLSGFASAAGESLVPSVVSDIFFLHERAAMMSGYTILIAGASAVGPLIASFIVQYSSNTWVDYVWVCAGLAGANTLGLCLFYPESNYHRSPEHPTTTLPATSRRIDDEKSDMISEQRSNILHVNSTRRKSAARYEKVDAVPISWMSIWTSFITLDKSLGLFEAFWRPLSMLVRLPVLYAVYIYGTSLAAQIILIFAMPNLMMAPPYLFSSIGVGLMEIAAIVGFVAGCFTGGYLADVITAQVIQRQKGNIFAAQRLMSLIPGFYIAPAGCIVLAFSCSQKLHWIAIAFGFGMVSFGTVFAPNIAVTYVVESYPDTAAEALVVINVFKNLVAFLFLYTAVDWVSSRGWIEVYMVMFMLTSVGVLLAIPLYWHNRRRMRAANPET